MSATLTFVKVRIIVKRFIEHPPLVLLLLDPWGVYFVHFEMGIFVLEIA